MADRSSKTEQPTQRRLEKAREEGQFPSAREFVGALQFMVFLGLVEVGGAHWWTQFRGTTRWLFERAFAGGWGATDLTHIAWRLFWQHFLPLALGGMAVAFATLVGLLRAQAGGQVAHRQRHHEIRAEEHQVSEALDAKRKYRRHEAEV